MSIQSRRLDLHIAALRKFDPPTPGGRRPRPQPDARQAHAPRRAAGSDPRGP